ncbi:hypothetical protein [Magnetococcus sp. PR-3]|uniref:hypothetical protein n=1 Tax=Magnetococcus sp. PR-3 TaxID=3120355 RepID=UPI002FCE1492
MSNFKVFLSTCVLVLMSVTSPLFAQAEQDRYSVAVCEIESCAWTAAMHGGWLDGPAWMMSSQQTAYVFGHTSKNEPRDISFERVVEPLATTTQWGWDTEQIKKRSKSWLNMQARHLSKRVSLPAWMGREQGYEDVGSEKKPAVGVPLQAQWSVTKPGHLELTPRRSLQHVHGQPVQMKGVVSHQQGHYLQAQWQKGDWAVNSAVGDVQGNRYKMETQYRFSPFSSVTTQLSEEDERLIFGFHNAF